MPQQQPYARTEGIRRLLSRVEAVHAVSWLWLHDVEADGIGHSPAGLRRAKIVSNTE